MTHSEFRAGDEAERPEDDVAPPHLRELRDLLEENDRAGIRALTEEMHAADLARIIEVLPAEQREDLIDALRPDFDPEILAYVAPELREEVIDLLEPKDAAAAVAELDTDDAVDVIQDLDEEAQREILENLPAEARALVQQGLTFPEFSAGRLMQRELVSAPQFWTVGRLIDYLRAAGEQAAPDRFGPELPEQFYDVFVVDPMHRVVGSIPLSRILRTKRTVKLASILDEDIRTIAATMDQEEVARLFRRYGMVSAPVIDTAGRLIGVITVDDVVDVMEEEATEDLLRLAGVGEGGDLYRAALDTAQSRFSWLAVNLLTAIVASLVIALFEGSIQKIVALAVLMPIVASMGGNAGTQTLTVIVRAIATRELTSANALRVVGKEFLVGLLNGLLFAVIVGSIAWGWFGDSRIGIVIALAMIINLVAAGLFGAIIPLGFRKLKIDPAIASVVFLTTVTDVVGFLAFLGLATFMLL